MMNAAPDNPWRQAWDLDPGTIYLNHGSFGPSPRVVQQERERWSARLQRQPMDFFNRQLGGLLLHVRQRLGEFLGTSADNFVLVDNATYAMNVVAASVPLAAGDEVLVNDHEYGAVIRLWERRCQEVGARLVVQPLTLPLVDPQAVAAELWSGVTDRTRLIICSHVTSPSALRLPVEELCRRARERDIHICIDGPHALAMYDVQLDALDCDFYCASCHKWLSAPFGSGFLYVHPRRQREVRPVVWSWGRTPPGESPSWRDEFVWAGTRDVAAQLSIPAAIDFLRQVGLEEFRRHSRALVNLAISRLCDELGATRLCLDSAAFYQTMAAVRLSPGDAAALQQRLWDAAQIEIPVVNLGGQRLLRVSCHLYTTAAEIDLLISAVRQALADGF